MQFNKIILPNNQPLFCSVWETRNKDCSPWDPRFNLPGHEQEPATRLTVKQIEAFCAWLKSRDGHNYRLPTDHEWSCMVGLGGIENESDPLDKKRTENQKIFPWGSELTPPAKYGNYGIDGYLDDYAEAAPVGHYKDYKNAYGLFDLSGNAREVCSTKTTTGPDTRYIVRGGSWTTTAISGGNPYGGLSSARRDLIQEESALPDVGFRLVYSP